MCAALRRPLLYVGFPRMDSKTTGEEALTPLYLQRRQGEFFQVRSSCDIKRQTVSRGSELFCHLSLPQLKYRHLLVLWPVFAVSFQRGGRRLFRAQHSNEKLQPMRASRQRTAEDGDTSE